MAISAALISVNQSGYWWHLCHYQLMMYSPLPLFAVYFSITNLAYNWTRVGCGRHASLAKIAIRTQANSHFCIHILFCSVSSSNCNRPTGCYALFYAFVCLCDCLNRPPPLASFDEITFLLQLTTLCLCTSTNHNWTFATTTTTTITIHNHQCTLCLLH